MGAQQSTPAPSVPSVVPKEETKSVSACPVQHKPVTSIPADSACPMAQKENKPSAHPTIGSADSQCPMKGDAKGDKYKNPVVYNVYNQQIDPKNQMPVTANQLPAPEQKVNLSVERQQSNIPKGGTESTWLYPSPQMFWNALVRKNKTEGVSEEDMDSVIRIHNNMNETTWQEVIEWEKLHPVPGEGRDAKLLRFLGRPDEFSPKAKLKMFFGHPAPFDRHDWYVDRGGDEVRYIIDYYHDEANADRDQTPKKLGDVNAIRSIKLDVRPALDSVQAIVDRVLIMPYLEFMGKTNFKSLPILPPSATIQAEQQKRKMIQNTLTAVKTKCEGLRGKLIECKTEEECARASVAMMRCTASIICPNIANDFQKCLDQPNATPDDLERSFGAMAKCVELFSIDTKDVISKGK